ncbi:uncharacterized protein P174DRAFT_424294 [Aspergillus novofumigatus IBT 16806]|uniref:Uncharacterized protein n=1 Tax=Aspergillus novofumigatus (strain IBT 16806) TaxID=1392255 RepID=A0A2I1BXJ8_ASPN1|nr:uncharacterized protein P174DRAFT_424294 [Aspergillus novofumigatus IBT 16806]PKX90098.1 hypothetical protein P174DRAFT_424294 [Aspergillus novofumigatus IBT 16806]
MGGRVGPESQQLLLRQVDACGLCKRTGHKMANCPYRVALVNLPRHRKPLLPLSGVTLIRPNFPLARVTVDMLTGLSPPHLRAALAKKPEEPREDIEEEPQERLQRE